MVTCLVWAAVLVVVLLFATVALASVAIAAFPIWPPILAVALTAWLLVRWRPPRRARLTLAVASTLALAVGLPAVSHWYSLAMQEVGYSGSFGATLDFHSVDAGRWLALVAPFSVLTGLSVGSWLVAALGGRSEPAQQRGSDAPSPATERPIHLPVHPVPEAVRRRPEWTIRVDGLVERPRVLSRRDLSRLPRYEIQCDFRCEEGWHVEDLRWRGIRLIDILALAGSRAPAAFVRVSSDGYVVPVALADVAAALLCDELDGRPVTLEHGGPWRLMLPRSECFTSVKWVDRLEVTATPGESTGEQIARARLSP